MVTPVHTGVFPDQTVKRGLNPDFCTFIFIKSIKFAFLSSITAIVSSTHCTVMLFLHELIVTVLRELCHKQLILIKCFMTVSDQNWISPCLTFPISESPVSLYYFTFTPLLDNMNHQLFSSAQTKLKKNCKSPFKVNQPLRYLVCQKYPTRVSDDLGFRERKLVSLYYKTRQKHLLLHSRISGVTECHEELLQRKYSLKYANCETKSECFKILIQECVSM